MCDDGKERGGRARTLKRGWPGMTYGLQDSDFHRGCPRPLARIRPNVDYSSMTLPVAVLSLNGGVGIEVANEGELRVLLAELPTLCDRQVAALERGPSDFIKARRHGEFWAVTTKRGRMWMTQSFTASLTTDYSERQIQEDRLDPSLRGRMRTWLRSPAPERALSAKQVRTVFGEYLSGRAYSLPCAGA